MIRRITLTCVTLWLVFALQAQAASRYIVRATQNVLSIQFACRLLGCSVVKPLDGTLGTLFLVTTPDLVDPLAFVATLATLPGIDAVELDRLIDITPANTPATAPSGLYDWQIIDYQGTGVWNGYSNQPLSQIIRLREAQKTFDVKGAGTVAVIDTGVDPQHPALRRVLVPGYDFTRDTAGGSELGDVNQSTAAVVDNGWPVLLPPSTIPVLDTLTASILKNQPQDSAFGHGTMVSGVVHLVAPTALIMPLKAFRADGSGYLSDAIRAIYYAVQNRARILNMSFRTPNYSNELNRAGSWAMKSGAILVASVGNDSAKILVYPAALDSVMGVASTTNDDRRSSFSNYGSTLVWVASPGEGVISTYPYGTYAAAWGTSFSAPAVSGVAALLCDVSWRVSPGQARWAISKAKYIDPDLGNGRIDAFNAVQAYERYLGR